MVGVLGFLITMAKALELLAARVPDTSPFMVLESVIEIVALFADVFTINALIVDPVTLPGNPDVEGKQTGTILAAVSNV